MLDPLRQAYTDHARRWREFHYVYPVIARRSRGLSIGINLCPDGSCNYDCVYCSVDRTRPAASARVDLDALERELRALVAGHRALFSEPEFRQIPREFQRFNDLAFSGDGEPTASPVFAQAVRIAADVRRAEAPPAVKMVVITNGSCLLRPAVVEALAVLDRNGGEVWAKLDAGTEEFHRLINRTNFSLAVTLENILATAKLRPIVIQSMFLRLRGAAPTPQEIAAYAERVRWLVAGGAQVAYVQVYTVARRTAVADVEPVSRGELEGIAALVRQIGLRAEVFD